MDEKLATELTYQLSRIADALEANDHEIDATDAFDGVESVYPEEQGDE